MQLYRNHQVKKIFVSGGIELLNIPEGDGMHQYLLEQGVPDSAILIDYYGNNSYSHCLKTS